MPPNRKVGMSTSRKRRQLYNFFTDMTQVMRSVPDPPFSYLALSIVWRRFGGMGEETTLPFAFSLLHKTGQFPHSVLRPKKFHFKNESEKLRRVSLLEVTSQISAKALHLGDAANLRATVEQGRVEAVAREDQSKN
ncbi:hypothetical protein TNCV_1719461 [Trichonephila clavipes]|nr:hypothetical protein TNCV_1719461 [Trichonephila clavipes]